MTWVPHRGLPPAQLLQLQLWVQECAKSCRALRTLRLKPARLLCPWDSQARILEWAAMPSYCQINNVKEKMWFCFTSYIMK